MSLPPPRSEKKRYVEINDLDQLTVRELQATREFQDIPQSFAKRKWQKNVLVWYIETVRARPQASERLLNSWRCKAKFAAHNKKRLQAAPRSPSTPDTPQPAPQRENQNQSRCYRQKLLNVLKTLLRYVVNDFVVQRLHGEDIYLDEFHETLTEWYKANPDARAILLNKNEWWSLVNTDPDFSDLGKTRAYNWYRSTTGMSALRNTWKRRPRPRLRPQGRFNFL